MARGRSTCRLSLGRVARVTVYARMESGLIPDGRTAAAGWADPLSAAADLPAPGRPVVGPNRVLADRAAPYRCGFAGGPPWGMRPAAHLRFMLMVEGSRIFLPAYSSRPVWVAHSTTETPNPCRP